MEKIKNVIIDRKTEYSLQSDELSYPVGRGVYEYESGLPQFNGKSFVDLIYKSKRPVSVLDVGCGSGKMLAELVDRYPRVSAYGLSAFDYRNIRGVSFDRNPNLQKTQDEIDYRIGDAHRLRKIFSDVKFDVIVSNFAFMYFADPLNVLRQCYDRLKLGGVAFIDYVVKLEEAQALDLEEYWLQHGIEANVLSRRRSTSTKVVGIIKFSGRSEYRVGVNMSIKKGADIRLPLPFVYSGTPDKYNLNLPVNTSS